MAGIHYRDLDGMRGVLAFCVVLLHFGINSFILRLTGLPGFVFGLCVDVFFLLSGFVLTASYRADKPFKSFLTKRFFRLAPIFYLTTIPALALAPSYDVRLAPFELAMAVPFTGKDPANFPAWSIAWEFYFPIAVYAYGRRLPQIPAKAGFAAALLALSACAVAVADGLSLYAVRAAFGLIAGHYLFKLHRPWGSPRLTVSAFIGLMVLFFCAGIAPVFAVFVPALASVAIWSGASVESKVLSGLYAQWLGAISYTVYMVHVPVLYAMVAMSNAVNANPLAKIAGILVSILLAIALTRYVEKPFIKLGARMLSKSTKPV